MATKKEKKTDKKGEAHVTHAKAARHAHGTEHDVLIAPWFSEKALIGTEKGVYVFSVPKSATKAEIAGAVQAIYNVVPKKIRVLSLPAKRKSLRTRQGFGTTSARHKAYVYLNKGDSIQLA